MRTHGRRFVDRKIQRQTAIAAETRDGILWDLDWDNLIARVKIQGSNEYVNVHFPRNEATVWGWMRPGNAVRIIHRGGVRGYAEIVGHGCAIPTPLPGNLAHPAMSELADEVLSGCNVTAAGSDMDIDIADGTYRIDGVTYNLSGGTVGYYTTSESDPPMTTDETYPKAVTDQTSRYIETSETDPPMTTSEIFPAAATDDILTTQTLDPAPSAGQFRYDAFVVGVDGIIDYLKGTAATTPAKPSVPANHILLRDYILVVGGTTVITDYYIGLQWAAPVASELSIPAQSDFTWDTGDDYPERTITVNVLDQYGWAISGSYSITLYLIGGTGNVYSGDDGYNSESVVQQFTGSSYGFKYRRDQTDRPEESPAFMGISSSGIVSDMEHMTLLDVNGDSVTGSSGSSIFTLTSASNVAVDWSEADRQQITAGHNITFSFPGAANFDKLIIRIRQDATGGRTFVWPSNVRYCTEITSITISAAANSLSYVGFIYDGTDSKYDVVANISGCA